MTSTATPNNALSTMTATADERVLSTGKLLSVRWSDAWITPVALRAVLATIPKIDWVKIPDRLDRVGRAVNAARNFRSARITGNAVTIELLGKTAHGCAFGLLTREIRSRGAHTDRLQRAIVRYDDTTDTWSHEITDPNVNVSAEINAFVTHCTRWQQHLDYAWVRDRALFGAFERMGAFPVGSSGGVYFIPPGNEAMIESLRKLVMACGNSTLHMISIGSDPDSGNGIATYAEEALIAETEKIVSQLEAWRDEANSKPSSLNTMLGKLDQLRDRAAQLAGVLRVSLDSVVSAVDAAYDEVNRTLIAASSSNKRGNKPAAKTPDEIKAEQRKIALEAAPESVRPLLIAAWAEEDRKLAEQQQQQPNGSTAEQPGGGSSSEQPDTRSSDASGGEQPSSEQQPPGGEQPAETEIIPTEAEILGWSAKRIAEELEKRQIKGWKAKRSAERAAMLIAAIHGA